MIALMKRILNVAGGYKGRIQLAFVFSFLKSLLAKAPIGMAFLVLTAFLDGSAGSRLCLTMGAAMAICLVMQVLCQHAADRLQSAAGFMVFAEKRMELGAHLRKLPMGYFTEGNIGKISSVLSTDMVFIEENCMTALADMMSYIFAEAIMLAFLFVIHPWLGLAGCALMLLVLAIAKGMRREGLEDSDIRQAQSENLTEAVLDFAEGIGIIKTYNLLGEKSAELTENFRESRKTSIDFEENHAPWQRRLNLVFGLGVAVVVALTLFLRSLEPERQMEVAKQLTEGTIKSVDEYTAGGTAIVREKNYYRTGAFIVDAFSEQNDALGRVPEAYKSRLEHYREILSAEQIKAMIGIAKGSIKILQDYINFLNNELEVSE